MEAERIAEEKATKKKRERAIKRWTQLIHGLRIRQRLQEQYAREGREDASGNVEEVPEIEVCLSLRMSCKTTDFPVSLNQEELPEASWSDQMTLSSPINFLERNIASILQSLSQS